MALMLLAGPAFAVQPGEILQDPALEARARSISQGLRCLVCRNENIDDSDASLARDLRILVRERLVAGDTDVEAEAFIVDRFGEFVLLRPTLTGSTILLWLAGPVLLLAGFGLAASSFRKRSSLPETDADSVISAADKTRLEQLLRD